ncbi:MAG: hypothetical protein O3B42_08370 [Actinomycetota bacterium]|nr:hypothetical protein [Actinomycetota bacterium]
MHTGDGLSGDVIAVRGLVKTALLYGVMVAAENAMRLIGSIRKEQIRLVDAPSVFEWLDTRPPVWLAIAGLDTPARGDP